MPQFLVPRVSVHIRVKLDVRVGKVKAIFRNEMSPY